MIRTLNTISTRSAVNSDLGFPNILVPYTITIYKCVKMFRKTKFHFVHAEARCWGKPGWNVVLHWRHCRKNYWLALHTERADLQQQQQHKMQQNCSNCIHMRKMYLIWYLRVKHEIETDTTIVMPGGAVLFHLGGFVTCHTNRFLS